MHCANVHMDFVGKVFGNKVVFMSYETTPQNVLLNNWITTMKISFNINDRNQLITFSLNFLSSSKFTDVLWISFSRQQIAARSYYKTDVSSHARDERVQPTLKHEAYSITLNKQRLFQYLWGSFASVEHGLRQLNGSLFSHVVSLHELWHVYWITFPVSYIVFIRSSGDTLR